MSVVLLGGLDLEIELPFGTTQVAVMRPQVEPHETGRTRSDADRGRIERSVDAVAGIDQVQSAAREIVAMVLDHELECCAASAPANGLEGGDPAVVERTHRCDRLRNDSIVG
jgi:hypothetical protein